LSGLRLQYIVSQALVAGSGSARARLGLKPGLERGDEEISRDVEKSFGRSELAMIVGTILKERKNMR
jgi:hypothetical protein